MPRRGVNETRAVLVADVVAGEERDGEVVAAMEVLEGMFTDKAVEIFAFNVTEARSIRDFRR